MRMFNTKSLLVKGLSYFLSFVAAATPFHAIAAEVKIQQAAAQGQSFAEMLRRDMQSPTGSGGTIHFPDMGESIEVKDLYPGTSGQSDHDASYFAPAGDDVGTAEEFHDDGYQLDRKGVDKQIVLYEDATSGGPVELGYTKALDSSPSIQGAAYKIILDKKDAAKPDLRNDPLVNSSRDVFDDLDGFSDCKLEEVVAKKQGSITLSDMQTCERIADFSGPHTLVHDFDLGIIQYVEGKPNYQSCGEGCLNIWVGTVGDNYWGGYCKIYEEYTAFKVINADAIKSVTIDNAKFDDYFQIYLADQMVWTHTPGVFPPETAGACERSTSWSVNPNTNVTSAFKNNEGEIIKFKTRTSVTGGGEGFARLRILFDPKKVFRSKGWRPAESVEILKQAAGGYCSKVEVECASPPGLQPGACVTYMGATICPKDVGPAPHPAINPLCARTEINLECSTQTGEMGCWENAVTGELECHESEGTELDTCKKLEQEGCGFIKSACLHEAPNGACHIYEETWDCGENVDFEYDDTEEKYVCDGDISCMGESCVTVERETSDSFGKAAALLNVVEHADGMMECTDPPGTEDFSGTKSCTIFKGEEGTCKRAMGGSVDCCEKPKGISLGDYLRMLQAMKKIDSALVAVKQAGSAPGATGLITKFRYPDQGVYNTITKPVTEGFQKITQPFVNYAESATGIVTKAQQMLVEKTLEVVEKVLGEAAKEFMGAMLKELGYEGLVQGASGTAAGTAAEKVGEEGAKTMAQSMGSTVGSIIAVVGWVYLAYQVAMLIIQMIYKCTKDEMQLMVEVQLKKCSYLGSYCDQKVLGMCTVKKQAYCCYDSPLARIVVEQGVKQLGRSQGAAKAPQCDGLTLEELERLDWDKIDLSEWTGMLIQHNLYAGANKLTPESVTGAGSFLPGEGGGKRANVQDRTEQRFEDGKIDDIRTDLSQKMEFSGGKR